MIKAIIKDLKQLYIDKPHRYQHVLGVVKTAKLLGERYQLDLTKLELAAWLHDSTKYLSIDEHKQLIKMHYAKDNQLLTEFKKALYHAYSAAAYAYANHHIKDKDILLAIMHHTVGRPNMSMYEKIIFISDYIEPNRTYESCVIVRRIVLEEQALNRGIYEAMNRTITYHETQQKSVPKLAYLARAYYQKECERDEKN
jgi:predicted HD superfamily hydrolase involved in NAD metabolism